ncbi:MAG TPA: hypothetical protein VGK16_14595 [Candidatus Limnocylindrales bacterium]
MTPRRLLLPLSVVLLVAACGGGATAPSSPASTAPTASSAVPSDAGQQASVIPVIVSSRQVPGPNRFVFSFLDPKTNQPAATPARTASVAFIAPGESQPGAATQATFVWAIEGSRGDYVANVELGAPGDWKAVFITQAPGGPQEAIGVGFQVSESSPTIAIGAQAPATDNPTVASAGSVDRISTDPHPDASFYELTVTEALAARRPFVLVFATPAFCKSAQCGPTLDRIKAVAAGAPDNVAFINVEPYRLTFTEGRLQPVLDANNQLQPVEAVNTWGILTEPWVFTVDASGVVRGSFEGVVGEDELKASVAAIAKS